MAAEPHDFVIVIPVADRPMQLADCLASLAELIRRYPYAGRLSVLVVDDSLGADNQTRHQAVAEACTGRGLACHYLSQEAQRALVEGLPPDLRHALAGVIGNAKDFAHKGASVSRNIAYLWLKQQPTDARKQLYWFIDSDQEFRVSRATDEGEELVYAIDYFAALERIFSDTPTRVLTGKVVGDPPVSPAVMAGTFLDDVLAFLTEMARVEPGAGCCLHGPTAPGAGDAAYHDMADLFGFAPTGDAYRYRCPVAGGHDHAACFADFAGRLKRFFAGEHPTRRSVYQPDQAWNSLAPARTIYTGNYVFTPDGLDWFVPFAALKLRMAGPTLGRILRAELGAGFVAANLPMLHKRTVDATGQAEFRHGIERHAAGVDLSGEFERQYFGDVMLFSVEQLTELGYPGVDVARQTVQATVERVESGLRQRYLARQTQIVERLDRLEALFHAPGRWWLAEVKLAGACTDFADFFANLRANFAADAPGWQRVLAAEHRSSRHAAIVEAIVGYRADRAAWPQALDGCRTGLP